METALAAGVAVDVGGYDAVVFDMDGVITDTAAVHAAAWKRMFDAYLAGRTGVTADQEPPFTESDYLRYVDGKQRDDGVESFLASRGIQLPRGDAGDPPERDTVWGLANRKNAEFQRTLAEEGVRAFSSSVSFVRELQRHGIGTAIISASRNCQRVLDAAGIGDLFSVRVDGQEAARLSLAGKPSPAVFLEATRRLGAEPRRTVVVEDALAGVQAGRAGSFGLVIGVDRSGQAVALYDAGADVVVPDLGDLRVTGSRGLPLPCGDPRWTIVIDGLDAAHERVHESLLTIGDGRIGTAGAPLVPGSGSRRWVLAAGIYQGDGPATRLLTAPVAMQLPGKLVDHGAVRRTLDLHDGVLYEQLAVEQGRIESARFSSAARPGTVALRARRPAGSQPGPVVEAPQDDPVLDRGEDRGAAWMRVASPPGGVAAAVIDVQGTGDNSQVVERVAVYESDPDQVPAAGSVVTAASTAAGLGFDRLLAEHRARWAARWDDADVVIEGDDRLQMAVRHALFSLMSSVADSGEAAVGARGLTGPSYSGHVFWDADTFVLPFLAATHPAAARAMLEYRLRRLPAARAAARMAGRAGARFPWESARTGQDVTPLSAHDRAGRLVPIRTGQLEEHIVAEVAWASCCYVDWSGDDDFARGPGLRLLVETARYWASRIRVERDGTAHIYGVIGPDEYHEPVDDNAFTNVIAAWNLRRAAAAVRAEQDDETVDLTEAERWMELSTALVDGYDPNTGLYEQFAGFYGLEPLIIEEVAPRRPIAADLLLGPERVNGAQVIKQADVLMLHHLLPDEVVAGSLEPNLRFYEPRTAHGSSLSPAVHAALFARTRDFGHALEALEIASRIDLDDLTGTSAGGLHLATMGGLWQALAFGFAGLRPRSGRLAVDPVLPPSWGALEVRVRFRGTRVIVRVERSELSVRADAPVEVTVAGQPYTAGPSALTLRRRGPSWEEVT